MSGLPANYMFIAADHGSHTFDSVALKTAGSQTIAATDSANHNITGSVTDHRDLCDREQALYQRSPELRTWSRGTRSPI